MGSIRSEETDELFRAILLLSDIEECYNFFEDICTIKEVLDISQRLQVAKKLKENKSYQEISKEIGASTATISKVNKCLMYGSGGYKCILEKLEKSEA